MATIGAKANMFFSFFDYQGHLATFVGIGLPLGMGVDHHGLLTV